MNKLINSMAQGLFKSGSTWSCFFNEIRFTFQKTGQHYGTTKYIFTHCKRFFHTSLSVCLRDIDIITLKYHYVIIINLTGFFYKPSISVYHFHRQIPCLVLPPFSPPLTLSPGAEFPPWWYNQNLTETARQATRDRNFF